MAILLNDVKQRVKRLIPPGMISATLDQDIKLFATEVVEEIFSADRYRFLRLTGIMNTIIGNREPSILFDADLHADIEEWETLYIEGYDPLTFVEYDQFIRDYVSIESTADTPGQPMVYTVKDDMMQVLVHPSPDAIYAINYSAFHVPKGENIIAGDGSVGDPYTFTLMPVQYLSTLVNGVIFKLTANEPIGERYAALYSGSLQNMRNRQKEAEVKQKGTLRRESEMRSFNSADAITKAFKRY